MREFSNVISGSDLARGTLELLPERGIDLLDMTIDNMLGISRQGVVVDKLR